MSINIEVTLTPEQVQIACAEYLARQNLEVIGDVEIKIKSGINHGGYVSVQNGESYAKFVGVKANVRVTTQQFIPGDL